MAGPSDPIPADTIAPLSADSAQQLLKNAQDAYANTHSVGDENTFRAAMAWAAEHDPETAIQNSYMLEGKSYKYEITQTALSNAIVTDPGLVLYNANMLEGADRNRILSTAINNAPATDPAALIYNAALLDGNPKRNELLHTSFSNAAVSAPGAVLENAALLNGPDRNEILATAFTHGVLDEPRSVLRHPELLDGNPQKDAILHQAMQSALTTHPDPGLALYYPELLNDNPKKEEILTKSFEAAATQEPRAVVDNAKLLDGNPHKNAILKQAMQGLLAKGDGGGVLYNTRLLDGNPQKDEIIAEAFDAAADAEPRAVLDNAKLLYGSPKHDEILETAATAVAGGKDAGTVLDNAAELDGNPHQAAILATAIKNAAQYSPGSILNNAKLLDGNPDKEKILAGAIQGSLEKDPGAILNNATLLNGNPDKNKIMQAAVDKAVVSDPGAVLYHTHYDKLLDGNPDKDKITNLAIQNALKSDPGAILDNAVLVDGHLDKDGNLDKPKIIDEAVQRALKDNPGMVLSNPTLLKDNPHRDQIINAAAKATLENDPNATKKFFSYFQEMHEELDDSKRFSMLKDLSPGQKFDMITQNRDDIYTSTYRGVVNSMLGDLQSHNKKLTDVLTPEQMQHMDVFMEAAASFNRTDDVLKVIPKDQLPKIVQKIGDNADKSSDLVNSNTLLSMMNATKADPEIRHQLESNVREHYEKYKDATTPEDIEKRDRFGLIASAYAHDNPGNISPDMKAFYLGMGQNPRYQMQDTPKLEHSKTVDKNGTCNELMVFSNDSDSKDSFDYFKQTYADKKDWKTEDKGSYISIESVGDKGTPVKIYANKPDHHDDGLAAIKQEVAQGQGQQDPSFQVFVGRGHSYHASEYLPLVNKDMNLVYLGSCGGFQNQGIVKKVNPDAQIIDSAQKGSVYVNDAMIYSINNSIHTKGEVNWTEQGGVLEQAQTMNKWTKDTAYTLPDKNTTAMMQAQYYKLHPDTAKQPEKHTELTTPAPDAGTVGASKPVMHASNSDTKTEEKAKDSNPKTMKELALAAFGEQTPIDAPVIPTSSNASIAANDRGVGIS